MAGHQHYMRLALEDARIAMQEAKVTRLVLGGRYASIGGFDLGRYTVESLLEFTGRKLEIITGVPQQECEAVRIEWMKAQAGK